MKNCLVKMFFLLFGCLGIQFYASAQVVFEIKKVPATTQVEDTLYLVGNFNNWNPRSAAHAFRKGPNQSYFLSVPVTSGELEYKITRGSWDKGETRANGTAKSNRYHKVLTAVDTIQIEVENWQDMFTSSGKTHSATAQVKVLSQEFWMPQLQKSRRVWLYLPPNYSASQKKYPVLYMQDGQNLFDAYYSYSGEWKVDEVLDSLFRTEGREIIVVGIDNGGEERMHEYTPWRNSTYGGGKGDAYADFLVQTLKPYIDAHYRTLPGKKHTSIAGSSMGGLISLYTVLKYPHTFKTAGVFSPAFWVSPELYAYAEQAKPAKNTSIYFVAGARESERMVADMSRMREVLLKKGLQPTKIKYEVHTDGQHSEWFWQREFPDFVKWLLK